MKIIRRTDEDRRQSLRKISVRCLYEAGRYKRARDIPVFKISLWILYNLFKLCLPFKIKRKGFFDFINSHIDEFADRMVRQEEKYWEKVNKKK